MRVDGGVDERPADAGGVWRRQPIVRSEFGWDSGWLQCQGTHLVRVDGVADERPADAGGVERRHLQPF